MSRTINLDETFVYVIDNSLGMSKGKIAAQVSHVAMYIADKYGSLGRAIVLKADHDTFTQLAQDIDCECVRDAWLTQVPPGTLTCIGFRETKENREIRKKLKLL